MSKQYETVIGLEVHVELATRTKIFCSCSTRFRRSAQYPHLPGLHRNAGLPAGFKPEGGGIRYGGGSGGQLPD